MEKSGNECDNVHFLAYIPSADIKVLKLLSKSAGT